MSQLSSILKSKYQLDLGKFQICQLFISGGGGVFKVALVPNWGKVALFDIHFSYTVNVGCLTVVFSGRLKRTDVAISGDVLSNPT